MVLRSVGTTVKGVVVGGLLRKQTVSTSGRPSGLDLSKYRNNCVILCLKTLETDREPGVLVSVKLSD